MSGFDPVFEQLKTIMKPYQNELVVKTDEPGHYSLNTPFKRPDSYVLWFGGVQIKKNYVSYHLMPVYGYPELLQGISPELKKRMQGKSCFNFKKLDDALLEELKALTQKGFECFKHEGLV
ncbi:hypothetical protein [uncultured Meiothermus sp.]|uniref:hypothetical protein n=1 Tax=uncultured Meiothermus sp. TaxID=157471 RepID=UPI002622CEB2|nr:hypothetical protein [uncultured Meiothermus sp.]